MIGTIVTMLIFITIFSLALGRVLGQMFWTPPGGNNE